MNTGQHNSAMHTSAQQLSNKEYGRRYVCQAYKYYSNEASSWQCTFFKDNNTIGQGSTMFVLIARDIHVHELRFKGIT